MSDCTCTDITVLNSKLEDHDSRLTKLEEAVAEKNEKYHQIVLDVSTTKNTVENMQENMQQNMSDMKESMQEIKSAIDKSDEKWEKLREQRNKDHLEEPKKRFEGLIDKLVYLVVGGFLTFILSQVFPFFK